MHGIQADENIKPGLNVTQVPCRLYWKVVILLEVSNCAVYIYNYLHGVQYGYFYVCVFRHLLQQNVLIFSYLTIHDLHCCSLTNLCHLSLWYNNQHLRLSYHQPQNTILAIDPTLL